MTATLEPPQAIHPRTIARAAAAIAPPAPGLAAPVNRLGRRPFDRLPDETPHAYALFCRYLDPAKARDLWKMAEENTPGTQSEKETELRRLQCLAGAHRWTARAHSYDAAQSALVQMAEERAAKQLAAEWLDRAKTLKREQMAVAEKMLARAKEMLAFPLAKKRVQSETGITEIHPAKWTFADAAKLVDTANKLLCLATGQATENIHHAGTIQTNAQAPAYNLDALSLAELETFRALLAKATPGTIAKPVFDIETAEPDDNRAAVAAGETPPSLTAPAATQNGPAAPSAVTLPDDTAAASPRQEAPTAAPAGTPLDYGPKGSPQGQAGADAQQDSPTAPAPGPCKPPAPCRDSMTAPSPQTSKEHSATPVVGNGSPLQLGVGDGGAAKEGPPEGPTCEEGGGIKIWEAGQLEEPWGKTEEKK